MILSDTTIRTYVNTDVIGIEPEPTEDQFQPASFDIRLGEELLEPENGFTHVDEGSHRLAPGRAYIGHTKDHVTLPNHIAAQLAGRSSVGRKGVIIHKTAGWIDPGFSGEITLELYNFSDTPVELDVGSRIGQLVFFVLDSKSTGYDGQYQDQTGPTL